jgi:transposase
MIRTYASGFSFAGDGELLTMTYGNGATENFSYNDRIQLTQQSLVKNSSVIQQYDYGYGIVNLNDGTVDTSKNTGQLARVDGYIGGTPSTPTKQWQQRFSYDSIGRLERAKEVRGDNSSLVWESKFSPEEGRILAVLEGRTEEKLIQWLRETWTEEERCQCEVVTIDMWDGYFYAALEELPKACICIDRFHVEKNLLEAVSRLRRKIHKGNSSEQKKELKGVRWLLVSNYDDLDKDKKEKLDSSLDKCPELALCHYVKEEFRDIFEEEEIEEAAKRLDDWTTLAQSVGSQAMNNFVQTVNNWKEWILNYFIEGATNGFAEGINNSLQLLKRKAYGFRNFNNFRLRVLLLHGFS